MGQGVARGHVDHRLGHRDEQDQRGGQGEEGHRAEHVPVVVEPVRAGWPGRPAGSGGRPCSRRSRPASCRSRGTAPGRRARPRRPAAGITTLVASRNQPAPAAAVSRPARRSPSTARTRPSMTTARAASSLQASATPTATANQPQRRRGGQPPGEQQRRDHQRVGVEVPPVDPLQRRVQQEAGGHGHAQPAALQPVAGQQVQRHRAQRHPDRLDQVQEVGAGPEPVGGHEQHRDQVHVVLEEVQPADGHERVLEPGQQPDALVVQAHVVAEGAEVLVLGPGEPAEHADVDGHQQPDGHRRPAQPGH